MKSWKIITHAIIFYLAFICLIIGLEKVEANNIRKIENYCLSYGCDFEKYNKVIEIISYESQKLLIYNLDFENGVYWQIYEDDEGLNIIECLELMSLSFFLFYSLKIDKKNIANKIKISEPLFYDTINEYINTNNWRRVIPFYYRFSLYQVLIETNINRNVDLFSKALKSGVITQETFNEKIAFINDQSQKQKTLHYFKFSKKFHDLSKLYKNQSISKSEFNQQKSVLFNSFSSEILEQSNQNSSC